jgi:hypothetical protein
MDANEIQEVLMTCSAVKHGVVAEAWVQKNASLGKRQFV